MKHFAWSNKPAASSRFVLKEGILPLGGILVITAVLVGIFVLCQYLGSGMEPVVPIHEDDGQTVVHSLLEEEIWFKGAGAVLGSLALRLAEKALKDSILIPK